MRSVGNAPKNGDPTVAFSFQKNAPEHRSVLVKDFSAKNKVTTLEHLPYSTDLAPTDFTRYLD